MLCPACPNRSQCRAACELLEADLLSREVPLREFTFEPELVAHVAERALFSLADLQPEGAAEWGGLLGVMQDFPVFTIDTLLLRYHQGLSIREIARRQSRHYVTIGRRLRRALAVMKSRRPRYSIVERA